MELQEEIQMSNHDRDSVQWRALPLLDGGVYVGMVTEVLDREGIANVVKTDLEAGGLGVVMGTSPLGEPWRIEVPEEQYARAMEIYESIVGQAGEGGSDPGESTGSTD
jgi:hypothetical protein